MSRIIFAVLIAALGAAATTAVWSVLGDAPWEEGVRAETKQPYQSSRQFFDVPSLNPVFTPTPEAKTAVCTDLLASYNTTRQRGDSKKAAQFAKIILERCPETKQALYNDFRTSYEAARRRGETQAAAGWAAIILTQC